MTAKNPDKLIRNDMNSGAGTVEDIDGNRYKTITIGKQEWMAENLRVTRFRNGEKIPKVTNNSDWANLSAGARCVHSNDDGQLPTYGYLYNWSAVLDSRRLAPEGWHVPTDEDWKELEMLLGMSQSEADGISWRGTDVGGKLKERGTSRWKDPNTGATNETGFTALPGAFRAFNGMFYPVGEGCGFWTSSECDRDTAWNRGLDYKNTAVYRYSYPKKRGFSVRCVKDK